MEVPERVLIKGAGDLASGVAHRLQQCGFKIVMLELPQPMVVRRTVAFASAVYEGEAEVEGVRARLVRAGEDPAACWEKGIIPVYVDPGAELVGQLSPAVLIDAIIAKRNTGTTCSDAPIVIGLGPGFTAPQDVHAVVETKRGHTLGRVIYAGAAEPNTGVPGEIAAYGAERVLRAPAAGVFYPQRSIGELVQAGETVAFVDGIPVVAAIEGLVRGMLFSGLKVEPGMKVGDIDPRGAAVNCHTISEKARAIAGGVLEAIMHLGMKLYSP
jgi:xanthine dehydrogenase accessory factor